MIIAIASGKGGTGKTTVSVNLATVFDDAVQLLDCDVEAPNAHLFLHPQKMQNDVAHLLMPQIDTTRCNGCGACSRFCQFNAIAIAGKTAMIFPELCHACGGCAMVCPRRAIEEKTMRIGEIGNAQLGHIAFTQGKLDVGVSSATSVINAVKARIAPESHAILDAPPGTACPAVATLRHVDYTVLVTEPTPFGLHDLKLAVATARELGIPFGVVINRQGAGDDRVHRYCREEAIPLLLEIPDDRRIAEAISQGKLIADTLPAYRAMFEDLRDRLKEMTAS